MQRRLGSRRLGRAQLERQAREAGLLRGGRRVLPCRRLERLAVRPPSLSDEAQLRVGVLRVSVGSMAARRLAAARLALGRQLSQARRTRVSSRRVWCVLAWGAGFEWHTETAAASMHSAIVSVLRRYRRERQREDGVSRRLPVEARRGGGAGARGAATAPVVHRRCCCGCCCGGAGLSRITPTWPAASPSETEDDTSPGDVSEASGATSWPDEDARGPSLSRAMCATGECRLTSA